MDSIGEPIERPFPLTMPPTAIAPVAEAPPPQPAGASAAREGLDIVSVERHGTRAKDFWVFLVARRPA